MTPSPPSKHQVRLIGGGDADVNPIPLKTTIYSTRYQVVVVVADFSREILVKPVRQVQTEQVILLVVAVELATTVMRILELPEQAGENSTALIVFLKLKWWRTTSRRKLTRRALPSASLRGMSGYYGN